MKIGKIISVEFDKFRIKLFHTTKTSTVSLEGQVYYFGNIGSYLKTQNPSGDTIICEVIAVLDHNTESKLYSTYNLDSSRELVIKPIGTLTKSDFNMGIGIFPSIYSDVNIVTINDIKAILSSSHSDEDDTPKIHQEIEIGLSKNMINYKINLNINKFFNIHTAILGNSGSGKSNTIAHILQEVFRKKENYAQGAKTILFDVNGEYARAFDDSIFENITTRFYKPNTVLAPYVKFHLPYYLMNLDEWLGFLLASDRTQKPFWDKVLQECFKFYKIFNSDADAAKEEFVNYFKWKFRNILANVVSQVDSDTAKITAAKGIIIKCKEINAEYKYEELTEFLEELDSHCNISFGNNHNDLIDYLSKIEVEEDKAINTNSLRLKAGEYFDHKFLKTAVDIVLLDEEAKGNSRIREFTSTMLSRLDYFITNPDCDFMRFNDIKYDNTSDYLQKVFGIGENNESQLVVVDSSEVGNDALELMTGVISRMIFDNRKFKIGEERRNNPVHLILDEAHRYIKKDVDYLLKENVFERIAREGRKFSLYLIISSQRPSELSPTVLSQCGNYIIHRIQNEVDMRFIYSVLPFFSDDYTIKIKQQVPGEALVFGNCVPMPLHIRINEASPAPNSENCNISEAWFKDNIL
ncbi:ATP-binding protein [uncultured Dokdonia sp.]|uniref:ATP-binding protein n=1 Tax=uncultured Dokdonia sp. TaxID=575653 RepID=UPI00263686F5|nr:ATP-binding protein [uncultured Dokdonia sp.]